MIQIKVGVKNMTYTLEQLNKIMEGNGGYLDLHGTQITSLPEGLTVGGSLDLCGTKVTSLPEDLTVGGYLDLRGTKVTSLPEDLTVGDTVYADFPIQNVKKLKDGDYEPNKYIYADGILTHVKRKTQKGIYTYYYGRIKGQNVIYDGEYYAHCGSFKKGVHDLSFKRLKERGAEQYRNLTLDSVLSFEDAKNMYRIITGACEAGTNQFISSLKKVKKSYSVREIIEMTKGQYGSGTFKEFFERRA